MEMIGEMIGIVKDVDKMGRIIIPKYMRDRYNISEQVEMIAVKEGIIIRAFKNEEKNDGENA